MACEAIDMKRCEVDRAFIGAGCNRIVNNVSWGASNFVAFGAHNAVAIFCPQKAQILTTLPGHKAVVNCTYWLPSSKFAFRAQDLQQHYLLSGDAAGTIMLWEVSLAEGKWRHVLTLPQPHKKGVTCISGVMFSATEAIFASTSSDGTVSIWEIILPMIAEGSLLMAKFKHLYWTPCAAHCIDLMLEDVARIPTIDRVLKRAIQVNSYIYQRPGLLNLMRQFTNQRNLLRPAKTRFATAFITLSSIHKQQDNLRKMFTSQEWRTSKWAKEPGGKRVAETILMPSFWNGTVYALRLSGPLVRALRLVDGEKKPAMGYIYEVMDRVKEAIVSSFNGNRSKYKEVFEIIDKRWDCQLHRPLQAAGNFLNLEYFYDNPQIDQCEEVVNGLYECIQRLVPIVAKQDKIMDELTSYKQAHGLFGNAMAIRHRKTKAPGECKLSYLESLSVGSKTMVALAFAELPDYTGHVVLAMGGLDNKIYLYCGERTGKFVRACELKGHSDWVRSLDFSLPISQNESSDVLLLVSSSQDKCIRIWKMVLCETSGNSERKDVIGLASYIEGPIFVAGLSTYQISLESLLIGHEDWVYSVQWQPPSVTSERGGYIQSQAILSASMDKTMMIWKPERTSGIWMNVVTVGELSHCALGFYGGHWGPNGDAILAHGYGGSFHLWKDVGIHSENWLPQKVPSGHSAAVSDIAWARSGKFLLSVSHDQTTRIFSPWLSHMGNRCSWHEIARPQVHGHDFNCVTLIQGKGNHRFVSGADEKVARVFEAPLSFLKTLNCAVAQESDIQEGVQLDVQILGAIMSALGLSQKPIYIHATQETTERPGSEVVDTLETVPEAVPVTLTEPPIEEQLVWHTLWPETHKLYGHGNELFSLCCDHEGKLVASSCKAQTVSVAEIWLWQVGSWKALGRLQSHSLTVTQMEFSHDDSLLLSVSRDRHFSVFSIKKNGVEEISYELVARQEAHKRIIWACSWNPFGHEFATGSRDKTIKLWSVANNSSIKLLSTLPPFQCSVTALSWLGINRQTNQGLLAVGLENGFIELWGLSATRNDDGCIVAPGFQANVVTRFDPFMCHASVVQRIAWKISDKEDCRKNQLASCGADNCVRVFDVDIN